MKKIILIALFLSLPLLTYAGNKWYSNGSLHRASVAEWNSASQSNRLATAADWAITAPKIKKIVVDSGNIDNLKPYAYKLRACVNEASKSSPSTYEASDLAVYCVALMGWLE